MGNGAAACGDVSSGEEWETKSCRQGLHTVTHSHTQSVGLGSALTGQLGPRCKPPAHLEGIRTPANKVRWPFSGWSLLSLGQEI